MAAKISQTADEFLDYVILWNLRGLGTDTILTSTFAVTDPSGDGVTISDTAIIAAGTQTQFFLTGGVAGKSYEITNTITTSGGRIEQQTVTYYCLAYRLT